MTLTDFVVGKRVFVIWTDGSKKYGTVGNLWSGSGAELVVRFDNNKMVRVVDKNMHLFHLDMAN
jgi:hypothetical protein